MVGKIYHYITKIIGKNIQITGKKGWKLVVKECRQLVGYYERRVGEPFCHQGEVPIVTWKFQEEAYVMLSLWQCINWKFSWHDSIRLLDEFFIKQSSSPKQKYVLNIEELCAFLGNFLILLEQWFCRTRVNSCVERVIVLFPDKIKFSYSISAMWLFWLFNLF